MTNGPTRLARAAAVAAALLAASGPGAAAGEAAADACMAKATTTVDIVECQTAELAIVDRALNAAYRAALASLPDDQRAKLVAAERLWVSFRQSDCEVFYGKQTGTYASVQGGNCMIGHARNRVVDLKSISTS